MILVYFFMNKYSICSYLTVLKKWKSEMHNKYEFSMIF